MPRKGQRGVTIDSQLASEWKRAAFDLGYGEKGMQKFLRVAIEIATSNPSFFKKR